MINEESAQFFLSYILNDASHGTYKMAPYSNGPDTDNVLYYKSDLSLLSATNYLNPVTDLRFIAEYTLKVEGVEFKVYSMHLKAGSSSDDKEKRYQDAVYLRRDILNNLPEGYEFFLCGDMNFYDNNEAAYLEFVDDQEGVPGGNNIGRSQDYLFGSWDSFTHTQSTRTTNLGDGGSTGGLDDRFDFIFGSLTTKNGENIEFIKNSYTTFGNDGNHYNDAITDPPSISIPGPAYSIRLDESLRPSTCLFGYRSYTTAFHTCNVEV